MPQNLMIYLLAAAVTLNTEETQTRQQISGEPETFMNNNCDDHTLSAQTPAPPRLISQSLPTISQVNQESICGKFFPSLPHTVIIYPCFQCISECSKLSLPKVILRIATEWIGVGSLTRTREEGSRANPHF